MIIIIVIRHAPCQCVAPLATNSLHSDLSKASCIVVGGYKFLFLTEQNCEVMSALIVETFSHLWIDCCEQVNCT